MDNSGVEQCLHHAENVIKKLQRENNVLLKQVAEIWHCLATKSELGGFYSENKTVQSYLIDLNTNDHTVRENDNTNESNNIAHEYLYFKSFDEFTNFVGYKSTDDFHQSLPHIQFYHRYWFNDTRLDDISCTFAPPLFTTLLNEVSLDECQVYQKELYEAIGKYRGACILNIFASPQVKNS